MGTERFQDDVSEALKKYIRFNPGQGPQVVKVNFRDALAWHQHERSSLQISDFVQKVVRPYVNSIRMQKKSLSCSAELLGADDNSPTRFE